jgi:hypothetical protein
MRARDVLTALSIAFALPCITSVAAAASEAWIETPRQRARTWRPRFKTESEWKEANSRQKNRGLLGEGVRGFVRSEAFSGTLVRLHGLQNIRSHRYAVIKLRDGTLRGWPVKSFSEADQAYVKAIVDKQAPSRDRNGKRKRTVEFKVYKKPDRGKTYELFESDHLAVWRGMDRKMKDAFKPEFMPRILKYMEQIWFFYKDALEIPMPWSDEKRQPFYHKGKPAFHKINIYLTETGLARHKRGWANGSSAIQIHPRALGGGSSVIPHEMGHVMQLYMGGMQKWSAVGSFWETHANWQAHQFIPAFVAAPKNYFDKMYYDLNWSGHRYVSWLWLQHLFENPRIGRRIPIDVWVENRKENGRSTEDPIQTFLRLFGERKVFAKDPLSGFGDEIGNMAARIVTMDYIYKQTYLDARAAAYKKPLPAVPLVKMEKVPDRKGALRPPETHIPGQYGINIAEIENPSGRVTVSLAKDKSRKCDPGSWRLTLVAVDKDLKARYSKMTQGATVSIRPNKGERVFVAVAAVPAKHKPREFKDTKGLGQSFPYVLTVR